MLGLARYHFFRTDTDPIPKIICRYRYRSDTKNDLLYTKKYLPIPISIRYQKWSAIYQKVSADTDPIPKISAIYQKVSADTDPIPKWLLYTKKYLPIPIRYQNDLHIPKVSADTDPIPKWSAIYQKVSADTDPIPKMWSIFRYRYRSDTAQFFLNQCIILYLSVCWPAHHSFVFYTQSTKNRQHYCKEKQQMNEYVIIIYDKNTFIN